MKHLWIITVGLLISSPVWACDVCSFNAGGNYFGVLPQFQRHFVGLRYQYREFHSAHHGLTTAPSTSHEVFHTLDLWGRYVPHPKWHIFAFMPMHYFRRIEEGQSSISRGLGDLSFMAQYVAWQTSDSSRSAWRQALRFGAGIKLPTGNNQVLEDGALLHENMQPGSGSVDFPTSLIYTLRHKKIGVNVECAYRLNRENKAGYHFGNQFQTSLRWFYWQKWGELALLPQAGMSYTYAYTDLEQGDKVEFTGGYQSVWQLGLDMYWRNMAIGLSYHRPLKQHLASGLVTGLPGAQTQFIYLF